MDESPISFMFSKMAEMMIKHKHVTITRPSPFEAPVGVCADCGQPVRRYGWVTGVRVYSCACEHPSKATCEAELEAWLKAHPEWDGRPVSDAAQKR